MSTPGDGRFEAMVEAARRYQSAEWAFRIHEDEPRMTPEHNARVEEWRAADCELRHLLDNDQSENLDLLARLDRWTPADNPGPLINWAAAHLRGCVRMDR